MELTLEIVKALFALAQIGLFIIAVVVIAKQFNSGRRASRTQYCVRLVVDENDPHSDQHVYGPFESEKVACGYVGELEKKTRRMDAYKNALCVVTELQDVNDW